MHGRRHLPWLAQSIPLSKCRRLWGRGAGDNCCVRVWLSEVPQLRH